MAEPLESWRATIYSQAASPSTSAPWGKSLLWLLFPKSECLQLRAVIVRGQAQWSLEGLQQESFLLQDKLVLRQCGAVKQTKLPIRRAKAFLEDLLQNCMEEDLIPAWYQKWGGHSEAELEQVLMLSKNHIRQFSFFLQHWAHTQYKAITPSYSKPRAPVRNSSKTSQIPPATVFLRAKGFVGLWRWR